MLILRWLAATLVVFASWALLGLPAVGFVVCLYPEPVTTPPEGSFSDEAGIRRFGASHLERLGTVRQGVWHLHLEGTTVERGWANGALTGDLHRSLEREMTGMFATFVPNWFARHLVLGLIGLNNRDLPRYFRPEELREIGARTRGDESVWGQANPQVPQYPRAVQYHALHDISHYLIDNPLIQAPQLGCTAVAVTGSHASDGRMLVGRIFDFEGGQAFDVDKVVQTVRPDQGLRFISVSWSGTIGVVTGFNESGLWISLNAGGSAGGPTVGRPTILAAREILATCRTLAEAEAILRRTQVFVSEGIVLASGPEHRAVVMELGPTGLAIRPMTDDRLVATNHFLAPAWADDEVNHERMEQGTSVRRFARATELLAALPVHDPASLLALLRDRRSFADRDVGFANRSTINAWIGAHLAVADLDRGILWVCAASHGLGRAFAFTVDGPLPEADLPASPDLAIHDHQADRWIGLIRTAENLRATGRTADAARAARDAAEINPRHFLSEIVLGETSTDPDERIQHGRNALALEPAYPSDRERAERLLRSGSR